MNINAKKFKEMLESGSCNLSNNFKKIDELNVFPVPDGDTGTNMSLTFSSGVKDAINATSEHCGDIAKVLSKGLLMGARGNSGVILSQIFRGFYQSVTDCVEIDALTLAQAFVKGSEVAYKAVMRPVEGTILTVIREAADYTLIYTKENKIQSCIEVMDKFVEEAKISLKHTPELLPVLKEVGVVDSGGAGLVTILLGFQAALKGEVITLSNEIQETSSTVQTTMESDEFGYCTEFIIKLNDQSIDKFKEDMLKDVLSRIGDSLVVVQDEDIVKVHVHTLKPGDALNYGQRYGEFLKLKIENMSEQHENILANDKAQVESKQPKKKYAIVAVAAGDGLKTMFEELRVDYVISGGQTMNPSTEDFVETINKLNAEHIILLPNNSNIVLAAQQSKSVLEDLDIHVVESKTIPQGLSACIMFNPDADLEENLEEMKAAVKNVVTGQITYAIKDTTFDGLEIHEGDFMGILEKDIVIATTDIMEASKALLDNMIDEDKEILTVISGEDTNEEQINEIVEYVESKYNIEVEVTNGGQPVYSFIFGAE